MAARGLDIASVTTVIHYDVARVVDTFIHRAGRTAVRLLVYIVGDNDYYDYEDICWTRVSDFIRGSSLICREFNNLSHEVHMLILLNTIAF